MIKYWKYIIISVLMAALAFSVYSWNNEKTEKERIINQNNINKKIEDVENGQPEVDKREQELYPKVDKELKAIDKARKNVRKKVEDEIKKANIHTISDKFTQLGYSSCIISR